MTCRICAPNACQWEVKVLQPRIHGRRIYNLVCVYGVQMLLWQRVHLKTYSRLRRVPDEVGPWKWRGARFYLEITAPMEDESMERDKRTVDNGTDVSAD